MNNLRSILTSFKIKDELNPKFWEKVGNSYILTDKVRNRLLEIANDFIESLEVDVVISDIVMTGSLANYNWSDYSDVDIHLMVDYDQFNEKEKDLYDDLFYLKKSIYNKNHDITIYGYDVEVYIEDDSVIEKPKDIGIYSILLNEWLVKPKKEDMEINYSRIQSKAKKWMKIIDGVVENTEDGDIESAKKLIKKYSDKLNKYRVCGLQKGGEYSDENLVFKVLRRNGYLEKIRSLKNKLIDKKLSLKELKKLTN
jgi:hypothetical protein